MRELETIISLLSVIFIGPITSWPHCPRPESLFPCECNATSGQILCGKTISSTLVLKQIFQESSRELRHQKVIFPKFTFKNSIVEHIESHTFDVFGFYEIEIRANDYLQTIDDMAFASTYNITDRVHFESNPSIGQKSESVKKLFDVLSQFRNASQISVIDCSLTFIPDYAFRPLRGVQSHLRRLSFAKNRIKSVGDFAFSNLPNLNYLSLHRNSIDRFNKLSLVMSESSDTIFIDMAKNLLSDKSFESEALASIHRPFDLQLSDNVITYLNESIFKYLFAKSIKINLWRNPIDCSDCRMKWTSNQKLCGPSNNTISYSQRIEFQCKLFKEDFSRCTNETVSDIYEENPLPCPVVSGSPNLKSVFLMIVGSNLIIRYIFH